MRLSLLFLISMFLFSLASADVGPSPASPDIDVQLQINGIDYSGINQVTYHCEGSNDTDIGAVDQRLVNISCNSQGECKNSNWFYKLNPCYYSSGFFSYEFDNGIMQTQMMDFTKAGKYDVFIEVDSGYSVLAYKPPGISDDLDGFCAIGFIFPVLVIAALHGIRNDQ
jgi:hypothetical protein